MDIQFMKDYYDLRYEETDGENHFVEETAYQEKQSEQSKMEDQLMEMVGGSESNVWKLSFAIIWPVGSRCCKAITRIVSVYSSMISKI